jgi:hypothetical protein
VGLLSGYVWIDCCIQMSFREPPQKKWAIRADPMARKGAALCRAAPFSALLLLNRDRIDHSELGVRLVVVLLARNEAHGHVASGL